MVAFLRKRLSGDKRLASYQMEAQFCSCKIRAAKSFEAISSWPSPGRVT
jgi:hypothetical protein